jgi:hypothetical protein
MKQTIIGCVLLVLAATALAQTGHYTVSGRVTDGQTGAPLQAASVFAQHTTFGTTTDADGFFKLKLPHGGYDLVVTFTGYQTESIRISSATGNDKPLALALSPQNKALEAVAVVGSNEVKDGWEKYGGFFLEQFVGKTAFGGQCTLRNKEALKFYYSKRKNRLKVLATAPIEVQNDALGYTVRYTVDSFTYDYGSQTAMFTGYPLFEESTPANEAQKNLWAQNRETAYNGSILHFMRSLFAKRLKEEGFEIQFLVKNGDAEQAIEIKNFYGALQYAKDDSTQTVEILPNQPVLAVLYTREKPDTAYLAQADAGTPRDFQFSFLAFAAGAGLAIEQNGFYYNQDDIAINSYWAWEKVGDMLPYDYRLR